MNQQLKSKFADLIKGTSFPNNPDHYFKILMEFGQAAYDMAKADEWVSVETELPEYGVEVLVWGISGGLLSRDLASYKTTGNWRSTIDGEFVNNVTHWQPLPTPPNQ